MGIIEVKINKKKAKVSVFVMALMSMVFLVLFYVALVQKWDFLFGNWFWLTVFGIAVFAFSAGAIYMFKKTGDASPALVIDEAGIIDNSGIIKGARHFWKDIDRFESRTLYGTKQILVFLNEPESFINKQSGIKKSMLNSTFKQQGTPVSIPGKALDYHYESLLEELQVRLKINS